MTKAKILDGGKLTLPLKVQKWLQVKNGDQIAFTKDENGVRMVNAALLAIEKIQTEMDGEAELTGLDSDEKIAQFCKEVRQDVYRKQYARND